MPPVITWHTVWPQFFLFDYGLPGRAKITLACMKAKIKCVWIPPHPLLQCWWFLSVLSVQKKRSFMFAQVIYAYAGNIEVGGVGDVVRKRFIYAASVIFARPVKIIFKENIYYFSGFERVLFFTSLSKYLRESELLIAYMYMCIYIYICMCMYIYTHLYKNIHERVCPYVYTYWFEYIAYMLLVRLIKFAFENTPAWCLCIVYKFCNEGICVFMCVKSSRSAVHSIST